jgi:hypothetical protein
MTRGDSAEHRTVVITELDKGTVQVFCGCGWCSGVFGAEQDVATTDARRQATEAQDLHMWEAELLCSRS